MTIKVYIFARFDCIILYLQLKLVRIFLQSADFDLLGRRSAWYFFRGSECDEHCAGWWRRAMLLQMTALILFFLLLMVQSLIVGSGRLSHRLTDER